MYNPRNFRIEDPAILGRFIQQHAFGILVSNDERLPSATHLPFQWLDDGSEHGSLYTHMARANPHWQSLAKQSHVLAIFSGPHVYVSPRWYEPQSYIPTWNYTTVHAQGVPHIIENADALQSSLADLTAYFEGAESPTSRLPFPQHRLPAVVGIAIRITHLEGKFKCSQNKSREDQHRVMEALRRSQDPDAHAIAEIIAHNLSQET